MSEKKCINCGNEIDFCYYKLSYGYICHDCGRRLINQLEVRVDEMSEDNIIHLSDGEKCWLIIGIGVGIILTFVILYLYTYLPSITPVQQSTLVGFVCGGGIMYFLQKINWK